MKTKFLSIAASAMSLIAASSLNSCDNDSTVGASILEDVVSITVDSTFTVTGKAIPANAVQSRTLLQLLGRIDATGFGSLSSDVVTQFMPSASLDTTGITVNDIDSMKLLMGVYHGNFIGDSITPMGIDVYRLTRDLPSPIYSNFDPTGYYDSSNKLGSLIYNASTLGDSDSLRNATYHTVSLKMPKSLAQEIFLAYKANPTDFSSPSTFVDKVFKGLYLRNSYGSGRLTLVSNTLMRVYYHRTTEASDGTDSIIPLMANYFAVTPEIVTNNNISLKLSDDITAKIQNGENIITSPTGYDVEFKFPIKDIIAAYKNGNKDKASVINSLTLEIPVDSVKNNYGFGPSSYILMILKNKKDEFFNNNSLPDNLSSFTAAYDSNYSCYAFANLRDYLVSLLDKEDITEDDYTFVMTPVNVTTETSGSYYYSTSIVTSVTPYITKPTLTKLLLDDAKIKFTYSDQSIKY